MTMNIARVCDHAVLWHRREDVASGRNPEGRWSFKWMYLKEFGTLLAEAKFCGGEMTYTGLGMRE